MKEKIIKDVAIYLRKSRTEETLKDLEKHRILLIEICERYGWKYILYQEQGTSQSIEARPEMVRLLKDIENDLYDAVLVIDQDRLSRGEGADADRVKNTLLASDTVMCIQDRIFNLENDTDNTIYNVNSFLAHMEYEMIVKRFKRGKVAGAKLGRWTNGPAPFPYVYDREKQELIICEKDYKIYRYIIDSFLIDKVSSNEIAFTLNKKGWLTRKNNFWTNKTILDLLKDMTHLGYIIKGKTRKKKMADGSYKTIYIPEKDWIVNENGLHKPVKTMEEHNQILLQIKNNSNLAPHRLPAPNQILPLTGLIECGVCGHILCLQRRKDRNDRSIVKKCWYVDPMGKHCSNRSVELEPILNVINDKIRNHIENIKEETMVVVNTRKEEIENELWIKNRQLKTAQTALEKIYTAFEEGIYDKDTFKTQREKREKEVFTIEKELSMLKAEYQNLKTQISQERLDVLKSFESIINDKNVSDEKLNRLYKSILQRIIYNRDKSGDIDLQIIYK